MRNAVDKQIRNGCSLVEALPAGHPLIFYYLRTLHQSDAKFTLELDAVKDRLNELSASPTEDRNNNQAANSPPPFKEKIMSLARKTHPKNLAVPAASSPPSENEDEHARPIQGPPLRAENPSPEPAEDADLLAMAKATAPTTKKYQDKHKKPSGADAATKKRKAATQAGDDEDGPPAKKKYSSNRKNGKKPVTD